LYKALLFEVEVGFIRPVFSDYVDFHKEYLEGDKIKKRHTIKCFIVCLYIYLF